MSARDPLPFKPECELLHEDGPDSEMLFNKCSTNPGHPTFVPVNEITLEHLPEGYCTERVLKNIKRFSDRTVKLLIDFVSTKRPDKYPDMNYPYPYAEYKGSNRFKRTGTGFIEYGVPPVVKGKPCPCPLCKKSGNPKTEYLELKVLTAAHVVFDDFEAARTVCELFYDSEDSRENVKYLYGIKGDVGRGGGARFGAGGFAPLPGVPTAAQCGDNDKFEKCMRDKFTIKCVTCDKDLFDTLTVMYNRQEFGRIPTMIISHPHGQSKRVTFGKIINHTSPLPSDHNPMTSKYIIGKDVKFRFSEASTMVGTQHDYKSGSTDNADAVTTTNFDFALPAYDTRCILPNESNNRCLNPSNISQIPLSTGQQPTVNCTDSYKVQISETRTHSSSRNNTENSLPKPSHLLYTTASSSLHTESKQARSLLSLNDLAQEVNELENLNKNPLGLLPDVCNRSKEVCDANQFESIQFQRLINNGKLCEPGVEYRLREKMTLILPPDATYFCRCPPCKGDYDPCFEIVEFPPGSRFMYGNSQETFPLPRGLEFNLESDRERFGLRHFPYHVFYTMDTCRGCSGALVVDENYMDFRLSWVHCGKTENLNRSGCYFAVYSMGWC